MRCLLTAAQLLPARRGVISILVWSPSTKERLAAAAEHVFAALAALLA